MEYHDHFYLSVSFVSPPTSLLELDFFMSLPAIRSLVSSISFSLTLSVPNCFFDGVKLSHTFLKPAYVQVRKHTFSLLFFKRECHSRYITCVVKTSFSVNREEQGRVSIPLLLSLPLPLDCERRERKRIQIPDGKKINRDKKMILIIPSRT